MRRFVLTVFLAALLFACTHTEVGEIEAKAMTVESGKDEVWRLDWWLDGHEIFSSSGTEDDVPHIELMMPGEEGMTYDQRQTLTIPGTEEDLPYLRLKGGRVEGYGGCNRIVGEYRLKGDGIQFSRLASTRRACISAMGQVEEVFLQALEKARSWMRREGDLFLYEEEEKAGKLLLLMKAVKSPESARP